MDELFRIVGTQLERGRPDGPLRASRGPVDDAIRRAGGVPPVARSVTRDPDTT